MTRSGLAEWRNAVRDHPGLRLRARAVALVLSTYMNGDGSAFPSRETLAIGAGLASVRSVDLALAELEAADLLRIRRTRGGKGRTNTYQATLPTVHVDAPLKGPNGASDDRKRRISRHQTVHVDAQESVRTLSKAASTTTTPLESGSSSTCEVCGLRGGRHLVDCPAVSDQ